MSNLYSWLTGQQASLMVEVEKGYFLHPKVRLPFESMKQEALRQGIEIEIVSGFRSFEKQREIWNDKVEGRRPVLDAQSVPLEITTLHPEQLFDAILRYSAYPGTSRHHWGTDFDVIDRACCEPSYQVQLTPEESQGRFGAMHAWLDSHMNDFGFFRPYQTDLGGVLPELWHLSYAPLSTSLLNQFDYALFETLIQDASVLLSQVAQKQSHRLFKMYLHNITPF